MKCPRVADGGDGLIHIEGTCEYIERAVADSRQGMFLHQIRIVTVVNLFEQGNEPSVFIKSG
jgi:hypothetical protein